MSTVNAGPVTPPKPPTVRQRTFSSLKVPNYRLYMTGQSISLVGTWMQMTAQSWLVLTLTHSSTALGLVVALQTLPVLLFGPYGGVVADRADKQRLMVVLQCTMGVLALVLGLLTVFGVVRFWEVCALAVVLGMNNAFENSTRQSFVREMVGRDELRNAITFNSVMVNAARAVGPAVGGVLIAAVGIGICFLLNAASFVAVVTSLLRMDRSALRPSPPAPRARGQLREGLRYAAATPSIAIPAGDDGPGRAARLRVPGFVAGVRRADVPRRLGRLRPDHLGDGRRRRGRRTVHRRARPYRGAADDHRLGRLRRGDAGAAYAPVFALACAVMLLVGWASVSFIAIGNSTIQLTSTLRSAAG